MTVAVNDKPTLIRRCPVCKIDRKGRFILANQQAQTLFGLSEVELFGRPFVDFLQATDRPAFLQLIRNRNPYETTFDALCVKLVDPKGQTTPATVIVSVNFGGGNPANYQVIIRPDEATAGELEALSQGSAWEEWVCCLLGDSDALAPQNLATRLHHLTGVATVVVHDLSSPECPLMASAGLEADRLPSLENAFGTENDINELPNCETLPNEVRATFSSSDGKSALVRLLLGPAGSNEVCDLVRKRAEAAAALLHSVKPPVPERTHLSDTISLAAAFDGLGFGFAQFDSHGRLNECNSSLPNLLGVADPPADVRAFIDAIAEHAGNDSAASIENHLAASAGIDNPPTLSTQLTLEGGAEVTLNTAYLTGPSARRAIFFVLRPNDERSPNGVATRGLSIRAGSTAVELLKSSIAAAADVWQKLEHQHHNELSRDGGFFLSCMSHHVETLSGTIADLERMLTLVGEREKSQTVDLELLVERLTEELIASNPPRSLTVHRADLPKIHAPLHKLTAVVRDVFLVGVSTDAEKAPEINVTATCESELCTILVRSTGPGITTRQIRNLFRMKRRGNKDLSLSQPGFDFGLALASEILSSLGGSLTVQSQPGKGATFAIKLPLSRP